MKNYALRLTMFTLVFLLPAAGNVSGHEGSHDGHSKVDKSSRTWTIAEGNWHVHGSFVLASHDQVQIRDSDGVITSIAINRLTITDQNWIKNKQAEIKRLNQQRLSLVSWHQPVQEKGEAKPGDGMPEIGRHFMPFKKVLKLRWDKRYLYVGSNGLPEHPMMVGIRSWQQQVPIPQKYLGNNAWRIPLTPVPAKNPMSTRNDFLRGAIALAVNGVPIFNPLNNRGDDAYLVGELDEYGGHCGRGDDYHYHIAPVHLEKVTGKDQPIAYALDGYPIYGYQDKNAPDYAALDELGGHKDADGHYHYHSQKQYPYLNGGFYGNVTKRGGQVDPQPRAEPVRPDLRPLRGATITGFEKIDNRFKLEYQASGKKSTVAYVVKDNGTVDFTFTSPSGKTRFESFKSRMGKPFLPQGNTPKGETESERTDEKVEADRLPELTVTSSAFSAGDELPLEFTGDGLGQSPPISWTAGPEGTKSYAVSLSHIPRDGGVKSYWVVYDIPADVTRLPQDTSEIGTLGLNDKGRFEYDPMKSKGPGVKHYQLTVFALSEKLNLPREQATRENLLGRISKIRLAEGSLEFQFTRTQGSGFWTIFAGSALGLILIVVLGQVIRNLISRAKVSRPVSAGSG